ncbi:MAG: 3'-5' exonuclease [Bacteroidales bacterium]|jgi:ribonuclease D
MKKNDSNFKTKLSGEEISVLPRKKFSGEIFYINSIRSFQKVLPLLKDEEVFGFDTETKPTFRKGQKNAVSLLQLSTSDHAFLFRLNHLGFPGELAGILADKNTLKIGVAIHDDIVSLRHLQPFDPQGFVELQDYVKEFDIEDRGLKKLTANILGFQISKKQQTSNWESEILTRAQIEYAATDAWVCYEIYSRLMKIKPHNGKEIEGHS